MLARIHAVISQAADDFKKADIEAGNNVRAVRQHTIVLQHYFGARTLEELASVFGTSISVCYRERRAICLRIATYLMHGSRSLATQYRCDIEGFQLRLDRALRVATYGDPASAYIECDALQQAAQSGEQSIHALCTEAVLALRFGNLRRAQRVILTARSAFEELDARGKLLDTDVPLARIELCEAGIADRQRDHRQALKLTACATERLRKLQALRTVSADEFFTECLTSLAATLWNAGEIGRVHHVLVEAEAEGRRARSSSPANLSVNVALWRVRNRLLTSAQSWYPGWRRLQELENIFDIALGAGRLDYAIEALQGVNEIYVFSDNSFEAIRSAKLVISLANQQGNKRLQTHTALAIAQGLLRTRYFDYAVKLLSSVEQQTVKENTLEPRFSIAMAQRAVLLNEFREARQIVSALREPDPTELGFDQQIIRATVAHELGYRSEAVAEVERLLPLAESFGSAPVLADAYKIAAKVTAKNDYHKKVTEIANLLAS